MVREQIKKIFNWKIYLKNYPDLFHMGITDEKKALEHWLNHGKSEEKIAYIYLEDVNFDWVLYINNYSDLYDAGIYIEKTALEHWITHGKNEGRVCDKNIIGFMNDYATKLLETQNDTVALINQDNSPFLFRDFCLINMLVIMRQYL